uniref:ABC transporter permease n=1 Tax=Ignisphaera aggregans TaxID=334771 RepID=A0A7J2U3L8_9CREN
MIPKSLLKYLVLRLTFLFVTYIVALTIIFILLRLVPTNPVDRLITQLLQFNPNMTPEQIREYMKAYYELFGLDKPLWMQYLTYLFKAFTGDLGYSYINVGRKVSDIIMSALPWTLFLVVPATLAAWFVGNAIGAYAGYKRGSLFEKTVLTLSLVLSQTPYYWLAMLLLYAFAYRLNVFPPGQAYPPTMVPNLSLQFILAVLYHYILPFLSIFIAGLGGWAIGMRVLTIYELGSDHIQFAEALGAKESVLFKYMFRNSMIPQVTGLALSLGGAVGGALLTEIVFSYPGMGYILNRAIIQTDYPVVQGVFVILIATLFIANFVVDFVYALIDPRIRIGGEKI